MAGDITIVIPVFNASAHIEHTLFQLSKINEQFQSIILVNDGSTDSTLNLINRWNDNLTIINLTENKGQHTATRLGLLENESEWILTLDDDLPIEVSELSTFIKKAMTINAELIYASYSKPYSFIRKIGSKLTSILVLRNTKLSTSGSSTRMIKKSLIDKLKELDHPAKFLDHDLIKLADKIEFAEVIPNDLSISKSRYSPFRLVNLFIQMLLNR